MGNSKKHRSSALSLAAALDFQEDDLDQNRDGCLSRRQIVRLETAAGFRIGVLVLITSSLLVVVVVTALAGLQRAEAPGYELGMFSLFAIGAGAVGFVLGYPASNLRQDSQTGIAESVQGHVDLDVVTHKNNVSYKLTVSGERFTVDKQVFLAFKNDEPYAVYYAPQSRKLLSAEWLRNLDPAD